MNAPTPQQQAAIAARGNVLVAAGAGTGKTSTVTRRCLDLVLHGGCGLDQILMVTFTEAAAAEMRERIGKALQAALADAALDETTADRLAGELSLLDTAPISTLHGFCLDLVRRHFPLLGLDPQFVVLDESQTKPLIQDVLNELFRQHYAGATPHDAAVRDLVRGYGGGQEERIRELVVALHRHAQALDGAERWLEIQIARFAQPQPDAWRQLFGIAVTAWMEQWYELLGEYAGPSANVAACRAALDALPAPPDFAAAAAVVEQVRAADAAKWEHGTKTKIRKPLEGFFVGAEFLGELAAKNGAALADDWSWVRESMLTLLQLAQEFSREFARAKRELGGIDFADQEQLALQLLRDATGEPTAIAAACRERFQFVFVDECQDINAAQDAIIRAVSRTGAAANRFLVGDVKQSIYRFRLANPQIFQDYQKNWSRSASTQSEGQVLALTENFRSREGLLEFINHLFHSLMRPAIGGLDYPATAELKFGAAPGREALSRNSDPAPRVEFMLVTKDSNDAAEEPAGETEAAASDLPDLQTAEREAWLVARRLRELKESGHLVWRDGALAPVEFRDMVVLLRSVSGRAEIYAKMFHQAGVPLQAGRAGFLDAQEVTDALNLLRLLDNPLQDLPLLAVLRSPLVGLSADELVRLRLVQPQGLLWLALQACCRLRSSDAALTALQTKLNWFRERWNAWRELARHSALTHCLETALAETHYESLLLAGERGAERVANLRQLLDLARRFDPYQREGLYRFLQFIAAQEAAEVRHEPAAASHGNAVRLLSIHASKGLEFPVVVLAGTGGKFNLRDLHRDVLLNESLGICPKVLAPESRRRYPSIAHWLAAQAERRALLGEELRLLYVALTRAQDTLILTGTASRKDELARWQEPAPVTDATMLKAGSCLDWLRLWFASAIPAGAWHTATSGSTSLLRWNCFGPDDPVFASDIKNSLGTDAPIPPSAETVATLQKRLQWSYPHLPATREAAKTSVSVLRRRAVEPDEDAAPAFSFQRPPGFSHNYNTSGKLSAAEIGTAHHRFMELVAPARTATAMDLRNEATQMQELGVLTVAELAALDFAALEQFWQSRLGQDIRTLSPGELHREMPFTARINPADLEQLGLPHSAQLDGDDFVVIQGIADLVVLRPREIWLVDFKTDALAVADLEQKLEMYQPQLKLYALALARIYARPVTRCWLHFFALRSSVAVDLS
ncbi:MAG TPA: UvrD-helicase domain-containing protein [Dongiaceae bacterium]|nr:UvrD-helicase domain-containing protein [Dongiaceae bacterium]